jgi:hypothetical protein
MKAEQYIESNAWLIHHIGNNSALKWFVFSNPCLLEHLSKYVLSHNVQFAIPGIYQIYFQQQYFQRSSEQFFNKGITRIMQQ